MTGPKNYELTAPGKKQLPTLEELHHDIDVAYKNDALNLLLNQSPPPNWLKVHPYVNVDVVVDGQKRKAGLQYLPVEKVKHILTRVFQRWEWKIKNVAQLFNSVCVTGTLRVQNPITGEWLENDGIGAVGVQTNAGATAADMGAIKADAVMKAAPAAESYALKNAAEKFGNIFGGNVMKDQVPFTPTYGNAVDVDELTELYQMKKDALNDEQRENAERILNGKEKTSYRKLKELLSAL